MQKAMARESPKYSILRLIVIIWTRLKPEHCVLSGPDPCKHQSGSEPSREWECFVESSVAHLSKVRGCDVHNQCSFPGRNSGMFQLTTAFKTALMLSYSSGDLYPNVKCQKRDFTTHHWSVTKVMNEHSLTCRPHVQLHDVMPRNKFCS